MINTLRTLFEKMIALFGFKIVPLKGLPMYMDADMDKEFLPIFEKCRKHTLTSKEKVYALYKSIEYLEALEVGGDFVECGVWKGGSAMAMAYTLLQFKDTNRNIYFYDTFAGMTKPDKRDFLIADSTSVINEWRKNRRKGYNLWTYSPLEEVKRNMEKTGYPSDKLIYVKGRVEKTIPKITPDKIALLRLDTDWYKSTLHELNFLFPKVVKGGVIIIDDYGHFGGAKKAVEGYFARIKKPILLSRVDYSGRVGIKI
ncbi:TylF/MycF family methyltransferase [Patescibacteria group bacterium]|nr:TylF/MycF family methyltransferase [Patescibacteria group bacterium]